MDLKKAAKALKQNIPALFMALKDRDTPVLAKIAAAITVGYALSPIDLIPDFIPILGALDDLILLPALVALTMRLIPEEVWERSRTLAADLWNDGRPKKWVYAIPIVLIWLFILWIIAKALWF